jgi:hypothetical protein
VFGCDSTNEKVPTTAKTVAPKSRVALTTTRRVKGLARFLASLACAVMLIGVN